jgi:hypothetical protein
MTALAIDGDLGHIALQRTGHDSGEDLADTLEDPGCKDSPGGTAASRA